MPSSRPLPPAGHRRPDDAALAVDPGGATHSPRADRRARRASPLVLLAGVVAVGACSSGDPAPSAASSPLPTFTRDNPASTGDSCDDPTGDILSDATTNTPGTLREPAGIDLVHVEANIVGDRLVVKASTVAPWETATNPALVILQGDAQALPATSFDLRFVHEKGKWTSEVITFPTAAGQQQKNTPLDVSIVVKGTELVAEVPIADIPAISTTQWLFGSSSGVSDQTRLIDECLPFQNASGNGTTGSSVRPTAPGSSVVVPTTAAVTGRVGVPVAAPDGADVTVRTIDDPAKPNREMTEEAISGTHLAALEIDVCAGKKQVEKVGEARFTVLMEGGTTGFAVWPAPDFTNEPRFTADRTLRPGECERGWITFQVPDGKPIDRVLYDASGIGAGPFVTITR